MIVITDKQVFGVFKSVEVLEDRLLCNGHIELPFSVIGAYTISEDDSLMPPPELPPKTRDELKQERQIAVENIKVTTPSGKTFDGDEISQGRMGRAITALKVLADRYAKGAPIDISQFSGAYLLTEGVYRSIWVLADNTPTYVTDVELEEVLTLSGATQATIWVLP